MEGGIGLHMNSTRGQHELINILYSMFEKLSGKLVSGTWPHSKY
jgi:hypothetical protein